MFICGSYWEDDDVRPVQPALSDKVHQLGGSRGLLVALLLGSPAIMRQRRFERRKVSRFPAANNPRGNGFADLPGSQIPAPCNDGIERPRMRGVLSSPRPAPPLRPVEDFSPLPEDNPCQQFPVRVKEELQEADTADCTVSLAGSKIEMASQACNRLLQELDNAMQIRDNMVIGMKVEIETSLRLCKAEKEVLLKEREQAAAMKAAAERAYQNALEESRRAKAERQALEQISTDISVQIAELKRIQHQVQESLENRDACATEFNPQNQNHHQDVNGVFEEKFYSLKTEFRNLKHMSRKVEHTLQTTLGMSCSVQSPPVELKTDELDGLALSKRKELLFNKRQQTEDAEACFQEHPSVKRKMLDDGANYSIEETISQKNEKRHKIPLETILEEDAPGLFERLQERGLLSDLLYGDFFEEFCNNSDLEQDDFRDLEDVVQNLWRSGSSLVKQLHVRNLHTAPNNRPSYCLACLVSLIEQTRSMLQRGWHVEWGWCRQLRAFIFVFDKHNRIVIERPEYGYATYFFELVESLSLKWQVGRLIRVMSVPTISRTALVENRPLEVGQDMTIEEGMVLEDYGWVPNTGLGTLLNFCDRVVHDIKDEDNTDWRQKIGKCLMDGYDHGRIAPNRIPPKLQKISGIAEDTEDSGVAIEDTEDGGGAAIDIDIMIYRDIKVEQTVT